MAFELIDNLLKENDFENYTVKDVYILKVGVISYSSEWSNEHDLPENVLIKKTDELPFADVIIKEVFESLKKHSNVFDIKSDEGRTWETAAGEKTFISSEKIQIRIEQPERFQKFSDFSSIKPIEKFDVLFGGSTYIAYAKVDDLSVLVNIAHEFREICYKQINNETSFYSNVLGPCPIHPDIYVVNVNFDSSGDSKRDIIEIVPYKKDIVILVNKPISIQDIVKDAFEIIDNEIIDFYCLMAMRSELLHYNEDIHALFNDISANVVERINTPWYYFHKLSKFSKEARNALSLSHILWTEFEDLQLQQIKRREEFNKQIQENIILSHISEYLHEHTFNDSDLPTSLQTSIAYFEKEVHLFSNLKAILLASIIGAIIGSLITGLLTFFINKNSSVNNKPYIMIVDTTGKKKTEINKVQIHKF